MKVLMVLPGIGPALGGPPRAAIEMATALADRGVAVDIVTTNANGISRLDVPTETWIDRGSWRIRHFRCRGPTKYALSGALLAWLARNVSNYDVVHTIGIFSLPVTVASLLCRRRGIPYVMSLHGMLEPWALTHKAWKKRLYFPLFEKPALIRAGAIQVLTAAEAKAVAAMAIDTRVEIVPNGINPLEQAAAAGPERFLDAYPRLRGKKRILFLGRLDPVKGIDLLAPALARVRVQCPAAHLVVAGPDNVGYRTQAESFFFAEGCAEHVTFTGMLTGDLKDSALCAADAYVAPSRTEGFSVSILEAMAAGLPCVITRECNFPEAGAAGAAHVVELDARAIADALLTCLRDPQSAREMGSRARTLVERDYSWAHIAARMEELYFAVIESASVPGTRLLDNRRTSFQDASKTR